MIDLVAFGLLLDAIGAVIVLAPSLPFLTGVLDRCWPFRELERAKEQLYVNGEIERSDKGFDYLASAVKLAGPPVRSAESIEHGPSTEVQFQVGDETVQIQQEGYNLVGIKKADDDPLATAEFTLEYIPRAVDESGLKLLKKRSPHLVMTKPSGELPRLIDSHKERLTFRIGALLLLLGFVIQLFARLL